MFLLFIQILFNRVDMKYYIKKKNLQNKNQRTKCRILAGTLFLSSSLSINDNI